MAGELDSKYNVTDSKPDVARELKKEPKKEPKKKAPKNQHAQAVQGAESADFEAEAERISEIRDPIDRLLRSGVLALIHAGRAVLETGLSPEVITRTAGRSRRSYYDHFRGKQQFSEQLFDELLGVGGPTKSRIGVADAILSLNEGDLFDTLHLMATAPSIGNIERVNRVARQIVSALGSNDDYARSRIADFYERDRLVYEPVISSLVESWGLDFREPWTAESATMFFRVVVDGYAMRSLIEPDLEETETVFLILKTMFLGMARLSDSADNDSVDDKLREVSDMATKYLRERSDPSVVLDARQAIQDATMSELAKRGFMNTNLDLVARSAGISQVTIRRAMGDLDDICCELLNGLVAGLESSALLDAEGAFANDPLVVIERHFERLSSLMSDYRPLMESLNVMWVSPPSRDKVIEVMAELNRIQRRLISQAVKDGVFEPATSDEITASAMAISCSFLHSDPNAEPHLMATHALRLLHMLFDTAPVAG